MEMTEEEKAEWIRALVELCIEMYEEQLSVGGS